MIISRTPLRVSLFGGSTDVKLFYEQFGSLLIGFTLNQYIYVSCRHTPKIMSHKTIVNYAKTEMVDDNSLLEHDGMRGVLQYLNITDGLEIMIMTDLPARTGTGSSSSFVVGLLNCLYTLYNKRVFTRKLVDDAIYVERDLLKESGGIQDQIWAGYGGLNSIEINTSGNYKVKPLPLDEDFIQHFKHSMVLFYLGRQRNSFEISKSHNTKSSIPYKKTIHDLSKEALKAFQQQDIDKLGRLLDKSWLAKRQTSSLISNTKIDDAYNLMKKYGALGVKLLGAGGDGFMLCITDDPKYLIHNTPFYCVDFNIDFEGSKIIHNNQKTQDD